MRRHRATEGLNLAFLDIMACGLGAVVLLFLIIKHNVDRGSLEVERALAELSQVERQERSLARQIRTLERESELELAQSSALSERIRKLRRAIAALSEQTDLQRSRSKELEAALKNMDPLQSRDVVPDENIGEEEYLIGLKVEGDRIAILLDHSASMTDEKLVDIIRRKVGSDAEKRAGPKWLRTLRAARWLLNRVPERSQVALVAFNEKATLLGGGWQDAGDAQAISALFGELDALTPHGATNLQAGLTAVGALKPRATDIYLVTDGLPTKGVTNFAGPNPLAGCGTLRAGANNITGECRYRLFQHSLNKSAPFGARANIVLLPLEGDPQAASAYWNWAAASGGLLIAPARGWP